ncbi:FKBP-type peptidyl-prolyl cis-trans isomerase [Micromonospora sp. RP3T]|uniref:FKBP-type peptidyl-prolyl cis-trans isomerase n=1 Tax=Micromonospora sp. RP3T TaxID=2135446 RepID=UPI003D7622CB
MSTIEWLSARAIRVVVPCSDPEAIRAHLSDLLGTHRLTLCRPPDIHVHEAGQGAVTAEVRMAVPLPELTGLEVTVDAMPDDRTVEGYLAHLREHAAILTPLQRPARSGDFVTVDLRATVDGRDIERGEWHGVVHEVGAGHALDGLDETLLGMSPGESTTFGTTLVGGRHRGQVAELAVTVTQVSSRTLPELDDSFAGLMGDFQNLDELRSALAWRLAARAAARHRAAAYEKAVALVAARAGITAPDDLVQRLLNEQKRHISQSLGAVGVALEDYLAAEDTAEDDVDAVLRAAIARRIEAEMLLDVIAAEPGFGGPVGAPAQPGPEAPSVALAEAGTARRGRALAHLMNTIVLKDGNGDLLSAEQLADPRRYAVAG